MSDDVDRIPGRRAVTCFSPRQQEHGVGRLESHHPLLGAGWAIPAESRGLATRCRIPMLGARSCFVLVQLRHRAAAGREIAEIIVDVDGARRSHVIAARERTAADWQRDLVPVDAAASEISVEIHGRGAAVRFGTISIARAGRRPFYSIAHMCNSPAYVEQAVREGANAIETDIRVERPSAGLDFRAFHGFQLPYGARSIAKTPLSHQLVALEKLKDCLALVVFDCKPIAKRHAPDYRRYGFELAKAIAERLPPEKCLISVHSESMTAVFDGVRDAGFAAGLDMNMIDNTAYERDDLWIDTAEEHGVTMLGVGTDCFVPWDLLRSWFGPIRSVVNGRDANRRVRKVYYWTLASGAAMRKLLDLQVDGLIVNDPAKLARLLTEPPYASMYRLATSADSQFAIHGDPVSDVRRE